MAAHRNIFGTFIPPSKKDLKGGYCELQHRHFRTIAAIIRTLVVPSDVRRTVARQFGAQLSETNPNFDYDRFVAACLNDEEDE